MNNLDTLIEQYGLAHLIAMAIIGLIFQIIWLVIAFHTRKLILLIKRENRLLNPNESWLFAIPLINIFYNFLLIRRVTDSLNNEFYDRQEAVDESPTLKQGYYMAFSYLAANFPLPPFLAYAMMLVSMASYINYLIKIITYKRLLLVPSKSQVLVKAENTKTESDEN